MSRIGKKSILIPQGVEVKVSPSNEVTVKGSKGTLSTKIDPEMKVIVENNQVRVERPTDQKRHKALHGLSRVLISNMIEGVSKGFEKQMELVGVGYKAEAKNGILELSLGYSHSIFFALPPEVSVETVSEKGKNPIIILKSIDKQLIGHVAAKIRSFRKPEPYKGKGIKFVGEVLRRKAGKSASKGK
ncbi:MAG: 50S ribosomal protein L6 [Bacteroidia bacterium]|nr:50S ribosomal protein L6 [Bacteroidia bacterium]MDW8346919.1 50S ribosomal protein L6 [Bacteroidia bacterium]